MDEFQQITAAKRGDNEALAEVLQKHYLYVFRYLVKVTLHRQTAEDLTQDTMIRAIEKIQLYDPQRSRFPSWLITIATRLFLDHKRRQQREKTLLSPDEVLHGLRWQLESSTENWWVLVDALARLPDHTRAAVVLKHYYGFGYDEIADILKIPAGTVKSRIHHGLSGLRKEWFQSDEEAPSLR
ncbi:RNA polymerase sigma factor SigY [Alicyclobacillus curvatus]|jgi:RNA polymerase sigma-70 factor, ECF subfamily|nr:RNA polymerase sigma factor SigY [Alicyclobacillus curvatus]